MSGGTPSATSAISSGADARSPIMTRLPGYFWTSKKSVQFRGGGRVPSFCLFHAMTVPELLCGAR